jgi:TonB-linked SusC/RagA family outer membrane protein
MPLEKVCKEIERQTGYSFVYTRDMNRVTQLVTIKIDHADINETLHQVFNKLPFTYQVIDKVIVVNTAKPSISPVSVITSLSPEPSFKVSGVVLSEQGQPLSGASVTVKSTKHVVLTNTRGEFSLIVSDKDVLTITYVGYAPQTVLIKDGTTIQVRMTIAKNELDAMVIKGYYTTNNRLNTGNVSTVKAEDIQKQPVTDPLHALEGRVPGLYIQQASGLPGSYSTILLRGQNSIPSDFKPVTLNDPLFIIDGVPFSSGTLTNPNTGGGPLGGELSPLSRGDGLSPFNSLNPADIESIDVLKDADATAIYGSRGANGVILITTKKGRAGQTKVDVDVFTGFSKPARLYKLLNTQQYLEMRHEAFRNDQAALQATFPDFVYTPDPNSDYDLTYWDTTRYTDWQKMLVGNNAHFSNAQVSVSGGNVNTQFMVSGGYSNQGTVFPGSYGDIKASVHSNITHVSTDQRFRLQLTTGYTNENNNLPRTDLTGSIFLPPNAPKLYDGNGNLNWEIKNGAGTWSNPLAETYNKAKAISDNLISNLVLGYRIFKDLQITSSFGYNRSQMNQSLLTFGDNIRPPTTDNNYARNNIFAINDRKIWIVEPQVNYHHQIGELKIESLIGGTFQESIQTGTSQAVNNFISDALVVNPAAGADFSKPQYTYTQYKYTALYGRLGLNWDQKYLLNLTARRDGSSHFGPGKQFGNFGAVGVAWIFSSEKFMSGRLPWLSFGKLRASYGITGNDNLTDYQFLNTYSVNNQTYQGTITLSPTQITNPYYAWEENKKLEGGLELGLLQDRVMTTISYYRNRTENQLVGYPLPYITGFNTVQYNLPAVIQNTGLELTLRAEIVKSADFKWSSSFNISFPKNKLVAYPGLATSSYRRQYVVGQSLFVRYMYTYLGVDPQSGIYTYATNSGNGKPQDGIDFILKPVTQSWYGGWQNTFNYAGIQLDLFVQLVKQLGTNILGSSLPSPGTMNNQPVEVLTRWQHPGDQKNVQQFTTGNGPAGDAYNIVGLSEAGYTDASFARLKNLSLSYQLPKIWISRTHLQGCQLYFQGQNLFTITHFRGSDPETQGKALPPMKVFTIGGRISI